MKSSARNLGFTLVEILLVVSIIAVLSAFLIPSFSNYTESQSIRQGTEILKSDLRTAQNKALTGVNSVSGNANYWGVKISSDNESSYEFFYSTSNTSCDAVNITVSSTSKNLPGNVAVRGEGGVCVFFDRRNGDANFVGQADNKLHVGMSSGSIENACEGVEVNSAGMMLVFDDC